MKTCSKIVLCFANEELIRIGALKLNQSSAFEKSGLVQIKDVLGLELGYFFVNVSFRELGVSTAIARLLLLYIVNENIFATTELFTNNPMLKTLEKLGFKHFGTPYRSIWHDGTIGLFLRFKRGK